MNLKLNDYINIFYKDKPEEISLLKTTKDYKEFIDVVYNKEYDLDKLLIIYRDDIVRFREGLSREDSSLEDWIQEEINSIDGCYEYIEDYENNTYEVYNGDKELVGVVENGVFKEIEKEIEFISPKNIEKEISQYVIGQTEAIKVMSNAVSRQLMKINKSDEIKNKNLKIPNPPIFLIGESGVGKTYLLKKIEELYNIPMITVNCATLSKSGYVGKSIEDCIFELYNKCNGDINKTEHGIIFLDEIDKIASKDGIIAKERDVTSEVMNEALKLVECEEINLKSSMGVPLATINTSNILFVVSGAFSGIEKIVEKRLIKEGKLQNKSMGFGGNITPKKLSTQELRKQINKKDLEVYGIITELIGRIPILCNLNPLSEEMVRDILLAKKGILQEYRDLFSLYGKTLKLDKDIINYIVKETVKNKQLGIRALRSIIENLLNETLYNMPSEKKKVYTINKKMLGVEQWTMFA